MFEIVCPDKGIEGSTSLNLWDGGTISIREIIDRRLQARLVGADDRGQIIPTDVTGWAKAKSKVTWISIQVTSRISPRASTSRHPTVLRVTADQEILVDGEIQKAKDVRPGGTVLSSHHEPGPSVLHLMRSGLLGDACVVPGKVSGSAWFRGAHKETHRAYSEAIHRWLGPCATALTESGGMVAVQSRNYAALHDLRAQWYPDGVKQVHAATISG